MSSADKPSQPVGQPPAVSKHPGDEVPAGTPQTAESVCPDCGGSGRRKNVSCETCDGTGRVVVNVGDA
jgi:hypothetical protein